MEVGPRYHAGHVVAGVEIVELMVLPGTGSAFLFHEAEVV